MMTFGFFTGSVACVIFGATIGSKDKIGIVLFISIGLTCDKYKNFLNFAEQ